MAIQDVGVRAVIQNLTPFLAGTGAMDRSLNNLNQSLLALAGAATAVGAAMALSVRASISYESAFTGVVKTVDATQEQLAALSRGFIELSKTIPVSANELAKIGEVAGQLGIKQENILSFTRVIADLGKTTNLSTEEAATSLARLANILQTPQDSFDRLGSTIVALGNNFATTESEIVSMGLRLAGAGEQVGLTESQVLALAAGLSSVGIEAESGGSAFSRVLIDMSQAVQTNSDELKVFAAVAGQTADQFANSFKTDASGALLEFIKGLDNASKSGKNVFEILDVLNLSEIRVRDALLRASSASDTFTNAIKVGSQAWSDNNALTKEAETRYGTTESKLNILQNQIFATAKEIGDNLTPGVEALAGSFVTLLNDVTPAANAISTTLGNALVTGSQLIAILRSDVGLLADALYDLTVRLQGIDPGGLRRATQGMSATGPMTATQPFMEGWDLNDIIAYNAAATQVSTVTKENLATMSAYNAELKRNQAAADRAAAAAHGLATATKGAGGAAKEATPEFEKLGGSFDLLRRVGEDLKLSQETVDAAILSVGGSILDTGPIVEGYGQTVTRLAAAFTAAGLNGQELVDSILAQQAATKAKAEAEKAAAEAERKAEEDRRNAEEERKRAEEDAKRRREQALAAIQGQSARDVLGGIRGRGAGTGEQAADDFDAAVSGFEQLNTAGMDTGVAFDVMEARLGRLAAAFGVLNGDDLASAGATTDAIRKLKAAFDAGEIGAEELLNGLKSFSPELGRLAGEVDKLWEAWQKEAEAEKEALKTDRLEIYQSALRNQRAAFEVENQKIIDGWNERAAAQRRVLDIEIALANAQMSAGERAAARKLENRINRENIASAFAAAGQTAADEFGVNGPADLAALAALAQQFGISVADLVDFATRSGINVTADTSSIAARPQLATLPVGSGGSTTVNRNVTYDVTANYSNPQEPQGIKYDLQTAAMLAGR